MRSEPSLQLQSLFLPSPAWRRINPQTDHPHNRTHRPVQAAAAPTTSHVTIPAGTRIALVLTHPIQSRSIHRGDDIYAQITSPVTSGNEVVIPPGTFVQGKVDKLVRRGGRAELHLQSMSITFPDGYVAPVPGPVAMESIEGYALKDPGPGRIVGMFALPAAGAGLGAFIGHSVAKPRIAPLPSASLPAAPDRPPLHLRNQPVFGTQGPKTRHRRAVSAAPSEWSLDDVAFQFAHFFLDVGSPVEMVLRQPLISRSKTRSPRRPTIGTTPGTDAAHRTAPAAAGSTPRHRPSHMLCAGSPGTPPTVIPGAPGPDGVPGPPTIIPGTRPPGTPYPRGSTLNGRPEIDSTVFLIYPCRHSSASSALRFFCCTLIRKPNAQHRKPAPMPTLIPQPTRIQSAGNKPKLIDEYVGRVNYEDLRRQRRPHAQSARMARARPDSRV